MDRRDHRLPRPARCAAALAMASALVAGAGAARAVPLISEVFYDAVGSDDGLSFVELYGVPGTPLDGLVLEGVNGADGKVYASLKLAGAIGADGLFVVADKTSAGLTSVVGADQLLNFDLQNGPDAVVLTDGTNVLDAVGYGEFEPGVDVFAGEGTPAAAVAAGSSLARRFANVDTNDNAADFIELAVPTPHAAPVPEPSAAALSMAGLLGLGIARRGRNPRSLAKLGGSP
ncbi:MAG TPA: PEP-CTERM sorting domain-containing protein [Myxococcota bacterium]|nr:PEP-CTERM sorting domain-containing protein [Myxococcota bacterium]